MRQQCASQEVMLTISHRVPLSQSSDTYRSSKGISGVCHICFVCALLARTTFFALITPLSVSTSHIPPADLLIEDTGVQEWSVQCPDLMARFKRAVASL